MEVDGHPLPDGGDSNAVVSGSVSYATYFRTWTDHTAMDSYMTQKAEEILVQM
jgi:hypothetical protein